MVVPAVAILSFLPAGDKRALHTTGRFHSLGHFLVFLFVAYIAGRASRSAAMRMLLFVGVLVFGAGLEVAEHLMYGAPVEWSDVVVDSAGVFVGSLIALGDGPGEG